MKYYTYTSPKGTTYENNVNITATSVNIIIQKANLSLNKHKSIFQLQQMVTKSTYL